MSEKKPQEPMLVRVGVMDRQRPEGVISLPVHQLSGLQRFWRGARKGLSLSGGLFIVGNLALLFVPLPHFHLCLIPIALFSGPILAVFAWREGVVLGSTELPCPRCKEPVTIPEGLGGWPARFNCHHCGVMVELNRA